MRELTMDELEQVSGGDFAESAAAFAAAAGIAQTVLGSGWATMGVVAITGVGWPVAGLIVGLSFYSGYSLLN